MTTAADAALLTPKQAAERLAIARHTLARWRLEGGGPPFLKLGGAVRYDVGDLDAFLVAARRRSTSDACAQSAPLATSNLR